MAKFNLAFAATLAHEGGYVNHKADKGGETYRGIARRFHPTWSGWPQIDAHFKAGGNKHELANLPGLATKVEQFYQQQFWSKLRCDEIRSQPVACELFDTAVNMGHKRGVMFLQQSVNLLCRKGAEIKVDGAIGSKTLAAVEAVIERYGDKPLVKAQNGLQFGYYTEIVERDPAQSVFMRGWLRRVW